MKKICKKVFHEISIAINRNGDPIYTLCCYMDKGAWFRSDSIKNAINSKQAAKIRENAINNKYTMCNDECPNWEYVDEVIVPQVAIDKSEISVSNNCNARCLFCFQSNYTHALPSNIISEWKNELLPNLKWVNFGGGEPLVVALDLIREVFEKHPETKIGIVTNGIVLDKIIPYIKNIEGINISINAGSRDIYKKVMKVDSFDRVVNNIKLIKASGFKGSISSTFVICRENIGDINNFIMLCKQLGIEHAGFNIDKTDPYFKINDNTISEIKKYAASINQKIKIGIIKEDGGLANSIKKHVLYRIRYAKRRKNN